MARLLGLLEAAPLPIECVELSSVALKPPFTIRSARLLGCASVAVMAVAFVASTLAFAFIPTLQVQETVITVAPVAGSNCASIAKVSRSVPTPFTPSDMGGAVFSQLSPFCPWGTPGGLDNLFSQDTIYQNEAACLADIQVECGLITYTGSQLLPPGTVAAYNLVCNFTRTQSTRLFSSVIQVCSGFSQVAAQATALFRSYVEARLTPAFICAPHAFNPPFSCTSSKPLSGLSVLSQSASIASLSGKLVVMFITFAAGCLRRKDALPVIKTPAVEQPPARVGAADVFGVTSPLQTISGTAAFRK